MELFYHSFLMAYAKILAPRLIQITGDDDPRNAEQHIIKFASTLTVEVANCSMERTEIYDLWSEELSVLCQHKCIPLPSAPAMLQFLKMFKDPLLDIVKFPLVSNPSEPFSFNTFISHFIQILMEEIYEINKKNRDVHIDSVIYTLLYKGLKSRLSFTNNVSNEQGISRDDVDKNSNGFFESVERDCTIRSV